MTTKDQTRLSNALEMMTKAQEALVEARSLLHPTPYRLEARTLVGISNLLVELHGVLMERYAEEAEKAEA